MHQWKQFWKTNKQLLLLAIVGVAAGLTAGVAIGMSIDPGRLSAKAAGNVGTAAVLPDTRIERVVTFTRCAHTLTLPVETNAFIGYTREELADFYADYEVARFDGERVTVSQRVTGCCPKHLLLREDGDGALSVYRTDEEFFSEQLVRSLPVTGFASLTEQERAALKAGVVFDSAGEIDAYIESVDS